MLFNGRALIFTFSGTQVRIAEHERLQCEGCRVVTAAASARSAGLWKPDTHGISSISRRGPVGDCRQGLRMTGGGWVQQVADSTILQLSELGTTSLWE